MTQPDPEGRKSAWKAFAASAKEFDRIEIHRQNGRVDAGQLTEVLLIGNQVSIKARITDAAHKLDSKLSPWRAVPSSSWSIQLDIAGVHELGQLNEHVSFPLGFDAVIIFRKQTEASA
ncbi:MAG TPA: hypothetical protein VFQ60_03235, partial [Patescibacteria group bacterium]|nr:hypothetical protein [Patescibacteria group bacterium]